MNGSHSGLNHPRIAVLGSIDPFYRDELGCSVMVSEEIRLICIKSNVWTVYKSILVLWINADTVSHVFIISYLIFIANTRYKTTHALGKGGSP